MNRQRVLLLCAQSLLGESLENILGREESIELIGPWDLGDPVLAQLPESAPDAVLVAELEGESERVASLTAQILDHYPDVPVIRVGLAQNTIRVYTSHTVPARAGDLMETISGLSAREPGDTPAQA